MISNCNKLLLLLFIGLIFPYSGFSQEHLSDELNFEVNRVYPYISISKEKLTAATNLVDLNSDFKPSWIRSFIYVEISVISKGKVQRIRSENDVLSQDQKVLMAMADAGTRLSFMVKYIPENTLTHNDAKDYAFTILVDPEKDAEYSGGHDLLVSYLKESAIDKIPIETVTGYALTAVKFTINEEGAIVNAHVFESSKDEQVDELLLNTIQKMHCWEPAEYSNGTKVAQDFVLTIGSMESCIVPLLSIRPN